jgi:rhodanese-related sulfurtransferase
VRRVLAAVAAILGVLALFARKPAAIESVAPVELAEWIRDRKPNLRIVDMRTQAEFDDYHLPRAERFTSSTTFAADDTIVLVAGGSVRARNVYVLRGGVQAWIDEVMNPTITADAPPSARATYERASIVSRYFGGVPRVVDNLPSVRTNAAAVRRRGC